MSNYRFTKEGRLKSRKEIGRLFQEGNSLGVYPLRLFFLHEKEGNGLPQVAFSVPKRLFKKAVHRNRIKRQMREAYRLKQSIWLEKLPPGQVTAIWVYTGREAVPYAEIEGAVVALLHRSARKLRKANQPNPPNKPLLPRTINQRIKCSVFLTSSCSL
jgi:ribonuclease P protein component